MEKDADGISKGQNVTPWQVFDLVKVKAFWYVLLRALREKIRELTRDSRK